MADVSEKGQEPVSQWAFIGFNLHRNTGKAHQSISGSNGQTIDNIQRTMRAYSETKSSHAWTLIRKLRTFLAKQVSQDFMHSFLGLIALGNHPFLPRAAPLSGMVSGLNQAGEVRQPRD